MFGASINSWGIGMELQAEASLPFAEWTAQFGKSDLLDLAYPRSADVQRLANFLQVHFLDEIELQHHCLPLGKLTDAARQCLFQGIALQKVVGPILNVREPPALVGLEFRSEELRLGKGCDLTCRTR